MSEILWIEHLILFFIFLIIVSGSTISSSKANATVNFLKIYPNSKTPFLNLFMKALSLN